MTNKQRLQYFIALASALYADAVLSGDEQRIAAAAEELTVEGIDVPVDVKRKPAAVIDRRVEANQRCGSWVLVEVLTSKTMDQHSRDTENNEFSAICDTIAAEEADFLARQGLARRPQ